MGLGTINPLYTNTGKKLEEGICRMLGHSGETQEVTRKRLDTEMHDRLSQVAARLAAGPARAHVGAPLVHAQPATA